MAGDSSSAPPDATEREALHRIELGIEWLHRAHGHLIAFHHDTGHAMDHFAAAEQALREGGQTDLADTLRDELLPRGVVDEDRWSYDVVEDFQSGVYADLQAFDRAAHEAVADGRRHVVERHQEQAWAERSE
ncbi:hypothetical protein Hrd1104_03700 [Halorhabdus sp. CBA1104]|uniref:hypothetical protein n=1 Tax=unclassified Halorhabdus TaxID=2621901 RepID=UPI0012B3D3B8|nr:MULTISPECIES: hypothetical protein [unclassified Halorhabdus]QGN06486.1 hypothetical protein Hrd1104_03700 [Halorhabdus sp. CBA1104]